MTQTIKSRSSGVGWVSLFLLSVAAALLCPAPMVSAEEDRGEGNVDYRGTGSGWTAAEIRNLAFDRRMAAVVENLKAARQPWMLSGSSANTAFMTEEVLDMTSVAHIRQAIKKETTSIPVKREDPLADFGRTANANDTCYLRTCGGDGGQSSCVTLCSAKKGLLYGKRPVAGACHVLCAVAAEPCRRCMPGWTGVADVGKMIAASEVVRITKDFTLSFGSTLNTLGNRLGNIHTCVTVAVLLAQVAAYVTLTMKTRTEQEFNHLKARPVARRMAFAGINTYPTYQRARRGTLFRDPATAGNPWVHLTPTFTWRGHDATSNPTSTARNPATTGTGPNESFRKSCHQYLLPRPAAITASTASTTAVASAAAAATVATPHRRSVSGRRLLRNGCADNGVGRVLPRTQSRAVSRTVAQRMVARRRELLATVLVVWRNESKASASMSVERGGLFVADDGKEIDMAGYSGDGCTEDRRGCSRERVEEEAKGEATVEIIADVRNSSSAAPTPQPAFPERGSIVGATPELSGTHGSMLMEGSRLAATISSPAATAAVASSAPAPAVAALAATTPPLPAPLIVRHADRLIAAHFLNKIKEAGAEFILSTCRRIRGRNAVASMKTSIINEGAGGRVQELLAKTVWMPALSAATEGCGFVIKTVKKRGNGTVPRAVMDGFSREIKILKRIPLGAHENIVPVYDLSVRQSSIVMLRCDVDLCQFLRNKLGPLPRTDCIRYMRQITSATRYVHALGVVHGDLKLNNILIHPVCKRAMICDFGMSGDIGTAVLGGSAPFFSAETFALNKSCRARLSTAGDVFAIGVMFQQLLSSSPEPVTLPKIAMAAMPYPPGGAGMFLREFDLYIEDLMNLCKTGGNARNEKRLAQARDFRLFLHATKVPMWLRMQPLEMTYLSRNMWPGQANLRFQTEVVTVVKALMHRDPSRRLALGTLDCLLTCPTIWQDATLLETSGYTSAAAGRGGGSRSGGDGDNLALIAEDPHVPPGPSPPSVPASFPSSLPPPIVEICEIPPPFKRVLDRIGEDEGREMMLDETARRPDWMRLCEEWWVDFPSLEVLRQQRQQLQ